MTRKLRTAPKGPGTGKCPYCRRTVNKLALFATSIGVLCIHCLRGKAQA